MFRLALSRYSHPPRRSSGIPARRAVALAATAALAACQDAPVSPGASANEALAPSGCGIIACQQSSAPDIVFTKHINGEETIFKAKADGSGLVQLAVGMAPRWSPDHKKIAFSGWGGDHLRIFVMNADGTGLTQLTSGNFHGYQPAWSPDGTRLAFTGEVDSASVADLYVMKANGSGVVQLTTGASAYEPSWSPDGQKVVYAAYATGPRELYVISVNVANPVPTQLTFDGNQRTHGSPKYSADGSKIIYDSRSPYTLETGIFIMDANGLNPVPVNTGLTFSSSPSFSPDGKSIAFTGDAPGGIDNRAIYTVKLNGSSLKKVSTGFQPNGNPSWDQTPSWTWD